MKNKNTAYILLGVNVALGWLSWWSLGAAFEGRLGNYIWILPIILFALWGIAFSLSEIFIRQRYWLYGTFALSLLGYLPFVNFGWSGLVLVFGFLFLALSEKSTKKSLADGIHIHFYRVVNTSLRYFVTAVCIIAAVAFYFTLEKKDNLTIPNVEAGALNQEITWGLKVTGVLMPEKQALVNKIENGMTVDEYLTESQFGQQNGNNFFNLSGQDNTDTPEDASLDMVSQVVNEKVRGEMMATFKKNISDQLGVTVQGDEKVKDILAEFISTKQNDFLKNAFEKSFYVALIMALGLFLAIRLIGVLVEILIGFLILGIIKIFTKLGVVELKKEMREVGVIDYSL